MAKLSKMEISAIAEKISEDARKVNNEKIDSLGKLNILNGQLNFKKPKLIKAWLHIFLFKMKLKNYYLINLQGYILIFLIWTLFK